MTGRVVTLTQHALQWFYLAGAFFFFFSSFVFSIIIRQSLLSAACSAETAWLEGNNFNGERQYQCFHMSWEEWQLYLAAVCLWPTGPTAIASLFLSKNNWGLFFNSGRAPGTQRHGATEVNGSEMEACKTIVQVHSPLFIRLGWTIHQSIISHRPTVILLVCNANPINQPTPPVIL